MEWHRKILKLGKGMMNHKECTRMVHRVHLDAYFSVKLEKFGEKTHLQCKNPKVFENFKFERQ